MSSGNEGAAYGSLRSPQNILTHGSRDSTAHGSSAQQRNISSTFVNAEHTAPVTVDPSQVYDPWQELQRKRALEQAEEKRMEAKKAEEARRVEEARKAQEAEQARLARETRPDEPSRPEVSTAAALMGFGQNNMPAPNDLEGQMKAMFVKMREFHAKDPQLLAKIWEQERTTHQEDSTNPRSARNPTGSPAKERKAVKPQSTNTSGSGNVQPNTSKTLVGQSSASNSHREPPDVGAREPSEADRLQQRQQKTAPAPRAAPPKMQKAPTGTIWPPDKKDRLAEAAAAWLNTIPANSSKKTEVSHIRHMLDSNPSYIELCESLDSLGLKVDRAAFAKTLLDAVPEVNSAPRQRVQRPPQPSPKPTIPPGNRGQDVQSHRQSLQSTPLQIAPQKSASPSNAPNLINKPSSVKSSSFVKNSVGAKPNSTINKDRIFKFRPSPAQSLTTHPQAPLANTSSVRETSLSTQPRRVQLPTSKEEAAKKRSFAEIIDLTDPRLSEDDDDLEDHVLNANKRPQLLEPARPLSTTHASPTEKAQVTGTMMQNGVQSAPVSKSAVPDEFAALYSNKDIAEVIDKKKAIRRSKYNPKTIARDVLLATGRHPEMRALNAHLEILAANFTAVDATTDLSTFKWDLVDPGQPIVPQQSADIDLGTQADDEDEGDEESQRARAQIVIHRQVIDPNTGAVSVVEERYSAPNPSGHTKKLSHMHKRRGPPFQQSRNNVRTRPYGFGDGHTSSPAPGSSSRRPTAGSDKPRHTHTASSPAVRGGNDAGRQSARGGLSTYAALRQQMASQGTPLPKKRGRPVGWRKHIHGRDVVHSGSSSQQNASHVDPPKPKYAVYECKWKNCSGKLHNLETLRKHVKMLHGKEPPDKKWRCQWQGCTTEIVKGLDSDPNTKNDSFESQEAWMGHMEKEHLSPIAWQLGDGPVGGLSDAQESDASEAYLSDARGRQVTPRVTMPTGADPSAGTPNVAPSSAEQGSSKKRGRPPGSGQGKLRDQAVEARDNLERKKKQMGPGLDKGGSILVNEKRRQGFIDDEGDEGHIVNDADV
ncbi:MAG: hypothetical protein M1822_003329 [Bathelium mastoideum]|nr:MAG: hypothetical protein M1822_003329 [Bathelium mastoideum]